jgi:hypothetical protein
VEPSLVGTIGVLDVAKRSSKTAAEIYHDSIVLILLSLRHDFDKIFVRKDDLMHEQKSLREEWLIISWPLKFW